MENKQIQEEINKFEEKYGIDKKYLINFLESIQLGDNTSRDMYALIITKLCPENLKKEISRDIDLIGEAYFKKN